MTVIIIDNVALAELLEPVLRILFAFLVGACVWMILKMAAETHKSRIKRERLEEAKEIYTARKRQFEDNPENWKKWRDTNYKITDLVEGDTYY